ncbi:hypothetical protein HDU99_000281 [Rhizoclosmatium hyalinum]|nr:hypothetical protein HDU99_000281 [Rhizoclosmatium hyalinum]
MESSAVTFKTPTGPSSTTTSTLVHLLPCTIGHTGHANVSGLFVQRNEGVAESSTTSSDVAGSNDATETRDAGSSLRASFRGRGLGGTRVSLGSDVAGLVLVEARDAADASARYLRTDATFDAMTVWGHDDPPTQTHDAALRAFAWLEIERDVSALRFSLH